MKFTEKQEPNEKIRYNHVIADTPIGIITIEWKGWKDNPDYTVFLNQEYIGDEYTLKDAKRLAFNYISKICDELEKFLLQNRNTKYQIDYLQP